MKALRAIALVAGIAVLVLVCLVLWDVHARLVPHAADTLDSIKTIEKSTSDLLQVGYAVGGRVADFTDTLNGIASGLAEHEAAELAAAQDASEKLTALLAHADQAIADLDTAIKTQNGNATAAVEDFRKTFAGLEPALQASTESLQHVAEITGDPAIVETLHRVDATTAELNRTAAQFTKISEHLEGAAGDFQGAVHRATRPGNWAVAVGKFVLDEGAKVAEWAYGFFR